MSNRKPDRSGDIAAAKHSPPACIFHVLSIADHGPFTALSEIKGIVRDKLHQLHNIRDRRFHLS